MTQQVEETRSLRGRRPGMPDTRQEIRQAAQLVFAEHGYEKATVRDIARQAGVDPALVLYFFQSKQNLFDETIVQSLEFMSPPPSVFRVATHRLAVPLLEHVLSQWEMPLGRDVLLAVMRSAVSHEVAAEGLRTFFETTLLGSVGLLDPALRCALVSSQLAGLTMMRYVVRVNPLASMDAAEVVAVVAPVLQHYISGDLRSPQA